METKPELLTAPADGSALRQPAMLDMHASRPPFKKSLPAFIAPRTFGLHFAAGQPTHRVGPAACPLSRGLVKRFDTRCIKQ